MILRSHSLRTQFERAVVTARLPFSPPQRPPLTDEDLATLPPAAQRYLRFMNVVGKAPSWAFRLHAMGTFRLGPSRPWMGCESWQYDTSLDIARIFCMRLRMARVFPVVVRDTYVRGRGRMHARALELVDVVDESGDELDIGELVTYLNDALLFAPSMLLCPSVRWSPVSSTAFDVHLADRGRSVRGRAFIDERGALVNFSTKDRYVAAKHGEMVRAPWSTPIDAWGFARDRPIPIRARAVWHLPCGAYTYARFEFDDSIELDVAPAVPAEPPPRARIV